MRNLLLTLFISIFSIGFAQELHWSYEGKTGPKYWSQLKGEENCGTCEQQSPINIQTQNVAVIGDKNIFQYKDAKIISVVDNGHTLQFNFDQGTYLTYQGKGYELKQFHVHEAAEHLIDGIRYPLEFHFVHIAEDGAVLVVGVLAKQGKENKYFNRLDVFKELDDEKEIKTSINFNADWLYPKNKRYYSYTGSLTTPPCTGGVTWIVFQNPISLSADTIEIIGQHLPEDNYRPVQPLNGRVVHGN